MITRKGKIIIIEKNNKNYQKGRKQGGRQDQMSKQ